MGGGIRGEEGSTTTILNSTISGNSADTASGGIASRKCTFIIVNSTISNNEATGDGDGVYVSGSTFYFLNTAIINNGDNDIIVGGNDGSPGIAYAYYSWYGNVSGTAISTQGTAPNETTAYTAGDLGSLADNGGQTQTMAVRGGSPPATTGTLVYHNGTDGYYFVDNVSVSRKLENWATSPTVVSGDKITTDQRGAARHDTPTMGAYEFYGDYTTNGTGTDWDTAANWNMYNGVTTSEATVEPNAANSTSIAVNHDMNVNMAVTIDQTTVAADKTLTVNTGWRLTVADGDGTDLTAHGNLEINAGGTLLINSGAGVDSNGSFASSWGTVSFDADTGADDGTLSLAAAGPTLGTLTKGQGTITFDGADQTMDGQDYYKAAIEGGGVKTLSGDATVDHDLALTDGLIALGDNNLTLGTAATVSGSPSATSMIVTNGTGVLKKMFSEKGSFTFPVGDNTAKYSSATLDFTSGDFSSAWAAVKVTNLRQPDNTSATDYLNRYWSVTQSGVSGFSCNTTFNYLPADVVGTEADIYGGQYKDSAWTVLNAVDAANNRFQATVTGFSDFTGIEASTPGTQASSISFSSVAQTQMQVSWTRGNGGNVLVVAHQGSVVDSNPVNGTTYTANAAFGSGTQIGTGNYVVYKGTGTSVPVTGLTANTAYHFMAYEFNDTGIEERYITSTATGNPNNKTTLPSVPGTPTATDATSVTQTGFTANWNAETGAIGYRLDVATDTGFTSYVTGYQDKDVGTVTTSSVTGLTAGTTYYYRVRTVNTGGTSANSNTITAVTVASAPTATDATSVTQTGFTANWNAAAGATGYRLDVATNTGFTSYVTGYQDKDVGNVTTSSVTGLTGGTTYYYRVRAENTGGTSANSNTITAAALALPTKVDLTGPSTVNVSAVSTVFTLTSQDGSGNAANVTSDTVFSLTSTAGTATFYSDAAGTAAITVVTISNGSSTVAFYYKDTAAGTPTVTATRTSGMSLGSDTHQVTVNADTATKVDLTGPATVNAGAVSTVFTLTSQDGNGNAANVTSDTVFSLTSNSTGTARFYSDVTGKIPITQVTITSGTQTTTFYYRDSTAGTPTVTATRTSGMSLGSATHQITVEAGAVSGTVFEDLNGNGIQDTGEPGINNVTVKLNTTSSTVQTTATTEIGTYSFTGVAPGSYTVQETDPNGYSSTTSNRVAISVSAGGAATANFGDLSQGYVTGTVFEDLNGNGIQDTGEPGIGNVTVKRLDSGGSELESTTTHGDDGGYSFNTVSSGNYKIQETDPSGYTSTTPNTVTVTVPAGGSGTANFGDRGEGTVSGTVYVDANGNGIQNADEPGISGVTVTLLDENGSSVDNTTTGADGAYSFTSVTSGSYTVKETDPSGYASTSPNSVPVSVSAGGSASASFGDQEQGTVSGRVFNDQNGSGGQETLESGLSGVTIQLLNDAQTAVQTGETDGDGSYRFDNVTAGNYTVRETDPDGFNSTTPNSVAVSVATGGSGTANFGDQEQGTVSGKVFNDQNGNGLQDTGEAGIGGVTVQLLDDRGDVTTSTTTVGDGSYQFENVTAGAYTVQETDPSGYASTTPNTVSVSVAGDGCASAGFGDQEQGTVSGRVFKDLNGNGIKDTGEDGLGGVTVQLNQKGTTLETLTTSGDGSYTFSSVSAGSYVVEETDPSGYTSTTNNRVPVHVSATGSATANFGDQEAVSVWGRVFQDLNGNGIQDVGEQGIGGVTIQLLTARGTVLETIATSGDGSYRFTGIVYGSYGVEETDPSGYTSTTPNTVHVSINASGSAIANFGDQSEGTISGTVFNDTNGNGTRDPEEQGIGQVTVTLSKGSTELSSTTTAGNGGYNFSGLTSDTYTVEETDPSGYTSTSPNSVDVTTGDDGAVANFGDIAEGSVSGVVFNDTNGNGIQDPGEIGVAGVTVNLLDSAEQVLQSVVTTADGLYTFHHLASGTYLVEEIYPSGYTGTTTNRVTVTVGEVTVANRAVEAVTVANFGVLQQESVSGVVFNDTNGNGVQDAGEYGVGGVQITLVDSNGATVSTVNTAGDGTYGFYNVTPGNYAVRETYPTGYTGTTPQTVSITLSSQGAATAAFGALQGDAPDHVTLTGPASADLDLVSDAFSLTSRNSNDDTSNVTADTVFSLTSNSDTGIFYSDAAGTRVIPQETIQNGTSTATFYYKDTNVGTPTITAAWNIGGTDLGSDTFQPTVSLAATTLAASTSVASSFTHFEVTVSGIRMGHNGADWVTIFSGTPPAKLDLVNGGDFPGISSLSLPSGTYNQVEVTFKNSLPVTGKLTYGSKTYYTTAATFGGASNVAGDPSNDSGSQTVFTFRISDWGALNANVAQTFDITPITVDKSTDYQPTLIFTISNKFLLKGIAGTPQTYYFSLSEPGVALDP